MTDPGVTYVLTGETSNEPTTSLVDRLGRVLAPSVAVHLCRIAPPSGSPSDARASCLPTSPQQRVSESWVIGAAWLRGALDVDIEATLVAKTILRVDWPIDADDEITLLEARLRYPGLRLAVTIGHDDAEDAYRYFDRLGLSWIIVPAPGTVADRAALLARVARAWLLDPRSHTALEPTASVFAGIVRERLGDSARRWRYRVLDESGSELAAGPWCSTVHAALQARAPSAATQDALDHLQAVHDAWTTGFERFCDGITRDALEPLAPPAPLAARKPV